MTEMVMPPKPTKMPDQPVAILQPQPQIQTRPHAAIRSQPQVQPHSRSQAQPQFQPKSQPNARVAPTPAVPLDRVEKPWEAIKPVHPKADSAPQHHTQGVTPPMPPVRSIESKLAMAALCNTEAANPTNIHAILETSMRDSVEETPPQSHPSHRRASTHQSGYIYHSKGMLPNWSPPQRRITISGCLLQVRLRWHTITDQRVFHHIFLMCRNQSHRFPIESTVMADTIRLDLGPTTSHQISWPTEKWIYFSRLTAPLPWLQPSRWTYRVPNNPQGPLPTCAPHRYPLNASHQNRGSTRWWVILLPAPSLPLQVSPTGLSSRLPRHTTAALFWERKSSVPLQPLLWLSRYGCSFLRCRPLRYDPLTARPFLQRSGQCPSP